MPKIEGVIKSEISRLARRQAKKEFIPLKREVRQMSMGLSRLFKAIHGLERLSKELKLEYRGPKLEASPEEVKAARLTPGRIARLRKKLGLSQREMGILTGATLGAVLSWEKGKFRPRGEKKAALVALRKMGKRKVKKLLAEKAGQPKQERKRQPARKAGPRRAIRRAKAPKKTAARRG